MNKYNEWGITVWDEWTRREKFGICNLYMIIEFKTPECNQLFLKETIISK